MQGRDENGRRAAVGVGIVLLANDVGAFEQGMSLVTTRACGLPSVKGVKRRDVKSEKQLRT